MLVVTYYVALVLKLITLETINVCFVVSTRKNDEPIGTGNNASYYLCVIKSSMNAIIVHSVHLILYESTVESS